MINSSTNQPRNLHKSEITIISTDLALGRVTTPKTLRLVKTLGYASAIYVLPHSSSGHKDTTASSIANQLDNCRMECHEFEVDSIDQISEQQARKFRELLAKLPSPVFAFSNHGKRASALWAASMRNSLEWKQIEIVAKRAGHDVSFLNTLEEA